MQQQDQTQSQFAPKVKIMEMCDCEEDDGEGNGDEEDAGDGDEGGSHRKRHGGRSSEDKAWAALSKEQQAAWKANVNQKLQSMLDAAVNEEERSDAKRQLRIREMGLCPMSFRWRKVPGGYVCEGGSHTLSDAQLDGL